MTLKLNNYGFPKKIQFPDILNIHEGTLEKSMAVLNLIDEVSVKTPLETATGRWPISIIVSVWLNKVIGVYRHSLVHMKVFITSIDILKMENRSL